MPPGATRDDPAKHGPLRPSPTGAAHAANTCIHTHGLERSRLSCRAPKDDALKQRVARQPVCAVHATRHLASSVQPADGLTRRRAENLRALADAHAAHAVVQRRRDLQYEECASRGLGRLAAWRCRAVRKHRRREDLLSERVAHVRLTGRRPRGECVVIGERALERVSVHADVLGEGARGLSSAGPRADAELVSKALRGVEAEGADAERARSGLAEHERGARAGKRAYRGRHRRARAQLIDEARAARVGDQHAARGAESFGREPEGALVGRRAVDERGGVHLHVRHVDERCARAHGELDALAARRLAVCCRQCREGRRPALHMRRRGGKATGRKHDRARAQLDELLVGSGRACDGERYAAHTHIVGRLALRHRAVGTRLALTRREQGARARARAHLDAGIGVHSVGERTNQHVAYIRARRLVSVRPRHAVRAALRALAEHHAVRAQEVARGQ
mmetsp:Transcript_26368/g.68091  ORF Transcript_26368/g.68091 Transcript_26368/m.68091 type:complete len:452 (-) Transcript_26368:435-1790(-)